MLDESVKQVFLKELVEKSRTNYEFQQFMLAIQSNRFVPVHLLTEVGAKQFTRARALNFVDVVTERVDGDPQPLMVLTALGKDVMDEIGALFLDQVATAYECNEQIDMVLVGQPGYTESGLQYGVDLPEPDQGNETTDG